MSREGGEGEGGGCGGKGGWGSRLRVGCARFRVTLWGGRGLQELTSGKHPEVQRGDGPFTVAESSVTRPPCLPSPAAATTPDLRKRGQTSRHRRWPKGRRKQQGNYRYFGPRWGAGPTSSGRREIADCQYRTWPTQAATVCTTPRGHRIKVGYRRSIENAFPTYSSACVSVAPSLLVGPSASWELLPKRELIAVLKTTCCKYLQLSHGGANTQPIKNSLQ